MKRHYFISILMLLALTCHTTVFAGPGWPANYKGVMLQGFYWDSFTDSKWSTLTSRADELSKYFDLIWIPNAATTAQYSSGGSTYMSNGYDPRYYLDYTTIYGNETELRTLINTYKAKGTGIIEDVVINHKNGVNGWCDFADESVVGKNTSKTYSISWDNTNFSGICCTDECNNSGYKTTGAADTGTDFSGYRDLDHTNATVQQNLITYQDYLLNELGFTGFRLDMVKGYSGIYTKMYNEAVNPTYSVGEYWDTKDAITNWIKTTDYTSAAFDFPLKFVLNSVFDNGNWDALGDKSITADASLNRYSVTFVDNHDTYGTDNSHSDRLNSSWSAANAFILAMPGTPCIFLIHYNADKTNIGAMITARKACGITNQSTILNQYQYNSGYVIETQGTDGSVYLQLGDATSQSAPDGYNLIASNMDSAYGKLYKFYATKTTIDPAVTFSTEGGNFTTNTIDVTLTPNSSATTAKYKIGDGEWTTISEATTINFGDDVRYGSSVTVSWEASDGTNTKSGSYTFTKTSPCYVYFNNTSNWSNVYAYVWNSATGNYTKAWPGTQLTSQTSERYYKFKVDDASCNMIIFNNGNDTQTSDLKVISGYTYSADTKPFVLGAKYRVYFNNTNSWSSVYCYSWNGGTQCSGKWPGTAMTYDSSIGCYYIDFTDEPANVIFNDGSTQTSDLTFVNGNLYDASGNNTAYATVLPTTSSVTITDGTSYTATDDVVAGNASYTRSCSNTWGTLCLPFAYSSNDDVQYYTIKSNTATSVVVSPITDVQPGQPVIFNILSDKGSDNKYTLTVSVNDAIVKTVDYGQRVSPVVGWNINGTYSETSITNEGSLYKYYIASNQFWYAEKEAMVPAYRAWLEGPAPSNDAKSMTIELFGEESSTGIDHVHNSIVPNNAIFNLQGQRLTAPQKGINIINGKKILVK